VSCFPCRLFGVGERLSFPCLFSFCSGGTSFFFFFDGAVCFFSRFRVSRTSFFSAEKPFFFPSPSTLSSFFGPFFFFFFPVSDPFLGRKSSFLSFSLEISFPPPDFSPSEVFWFALLLTREKALPPGEALSRSSGRGKSIRCFQLFPLGVLIPACLLE